MHCKQKETKMGSQKLHLSKKAVQISKSKWVKNAKRAPFQVPTLNSEKFKGTTPGFSLSAGSRLKDRLLGGLNRLLFGEIE